MTVTKFNSKKEALKFIEKLETELYKEVYYLDYGEYARPSYRVKKVRGQEYYRIKVIYHYYPGTSNKKLDYYL